VPIRGPDPPPIDTLASVNQLVALMFDVVAGLGWVLIAMPLVSWMLRRDPG
jgi:hypothetical protein